MFTKSVIKEIGGQQVGIVGYSMQRINKVALVRKSQIFTLLAGFKNNQADILGHWECKARFEVGVGWSGGHKIKTMILKMAVRVLTWVVSGEWEGFWEMLQCLFDTNPAIKTVQYQG